MWGALSDNLRASVLLVSALLVFGVMTALIKAIGTRLPLPEVLVIRQLAMTAFLSPLFIRNIGPVLRTRHLGLQLLRGFFSLGAMLFGFTALLHIPLADVTALGFSQVLFVTLGAVLILKEKVGRRRWLATGIGFVGVLIMLRPGAGEANSYYLLALLGAAFSSGITITVRKLSLGERTETIMLYQAIVLLAVLTLPATLMWERPTPREWGLLALIGAVGTVGQYLITRAYQTGEASALAPLDFTRLLIAVVIGYFVFSEIPRLSSLAGAVLVVGATIYTVSRNSRRDSTTTSPPET